MVGVSMVAMAGRGWAQREGEAMGWGRCWAGVQDRVRYGERGGMEVEMVPHGHVCQVLHLPVLLLKQRMFPVCQLTVCSLSAVLSPLYKLFYYLLLLLS